MTAIDGTTIEIVHTDAEGRMVLADTLTLASRNKPKLIIDYATLTGACVYAIGKAYSGVFTNKADFLPVMVKAGVDSGERVWPFPMDEDYDVALESKFADVQSNAAATRAWTISSGRVSCNGSSRTTARGSTLTSPPATTRAAWPTSPPIPRASGCALR